jgi:condensation enzyme
MPTTVVHPLSSQQQLWLHQPGAFGPGFFVLKALRITGPLDVAALQGALDDVVARHEMLRTIVVLDADPPRQEVHPPAPAWLTVRDRQPVDGQSREDFVEDLIEEGEAEGVPVDQLPLLHATLTRFDDRDSALILRSHHTACDAWSIQVLARDLAAHYAARTGARPLALPEPHQYSEYVQWQLASTVGENAEENMAYWRRQLDGAEIFTLPTDRPVRQEHVLPYATYDEPIPIDVTAAVAQLGRSMRASSLVVMLSAFNVMAHRIRGTLDPVINTIIHGRNQRQFRDTVGPFLNFLALRTDLAACTSFHDVLLRTRSTCLDAYDHEVPIRNIELSIPSLMAPLAEPRNCDFIFGMIEPVFRGQAERGSNPFLMSEDARSVLSTRRKSEQMPGGAAWNMGVLQSGAILGGVQYSPEEFDEETVAAWVKDYVRIVTAAVAEPDRAWRSL